MCPAPSAEFRADTKGARLPYGSGDASRPIVAILRTTDLGNALVKRFVNLPAFQPTLRDALLAR